MYLLPYHKEVSKSDVAQTGKFVYVDARRTCTQFHWQAMLAILDDNFKLVPLAWCSSRSVELLLCSSKRSKDSRSK